MNFADRLEQAIDRSQSFLCAGLDPQLENFPRFLTSAAAPTNEDTIARVLTEFFRLALPVIAPRVAAVKPNLAFFEQWGVGGIRAFASICSIAQELGAQVIADAKRGDIGTSAAAYSAGFLRKKGSLGFRVDAVTVSPFLGFDTVEPFLRDCAEHGTGIFVLVKTSNPGSPALQTLKDEKGRTASELIAEWLAQQSASLMGTRGTSSLGAVVGATYPDEARALRKLMPHNLFLIPGLGAQGGTAADAIAGFTSQKRGGVINISRALFSSELADAPNAEAAGEILTRTLSRFNREVADALRAV